ncbi:MAG: hypothetical protein BWX80_02065 [Candidatus Hydrogenedentes bacterium ADurb.Bin101]|nr:MAG: hypothetical protein BWX80_02065 [Candidatus Hydrogenedentes bacterium ADurb.Bin101]
MQRDAEHMLHLAERDKNGGGGSETADYRMGQKVDHKAGAKQAHYHLE